MSLTIANPGNNQAVSRPWQSRLAALFEVCGVYMVGMLIGYIVALILGLKPANPINVLAANPGADLLEMSRDMAILLLIQYGGILPLAFLVGWWRSRRKLADYGLTTARQPLSFHLLWGVVLFAVASLPFKLVVLIDHIVPLGPKAVTQQIVYGLDWSDYRFWIFMAVGSFLLIPVVEELFFRGYVQTRLAQGFGAPAAILTTAFFFEFSHGQYLTLSAWNASMLLGGVFSALMWGYAFYRTRSLIAVMVAHALVNSPVRGLADFILPVLMLGIVILYRRQVAEEFRKLGSLLKFEISSRAATILAVVAMTIFAILVGVSQDVALILGVVLMIAAVILEVLEKRKDRKAAQLPSAA